MTARAERRRWAKLLPAAGSKKTDERKAFKDSRGRRLQPRIDAIDAHAVDGGGSLGAWELGSLGRNELFFGRASRDAMPRQDRAVSLVFMAASQSARVVVGSTTREMV